MKKSKLLASVLSGALLLSAAFVMPASAEDTELVKDGNFPAGTTAWICVADENKEPETPMVFEDGKVVLSEDTSNWLHLNQTLTVEPATKYTFSITYTLSAGAIRLDVWTPGAEKPAEISCDMYEKGVRAQYGTEQTFKYTVKTGADQTEFLLDIRNNCGDLGQAVGEITNVSFVKVDTTPSTKAPTTTTEASSDKTEAPSESTKAPDSETQPSENVATPSGDEDDNNSNSPSWLVPLIVVVAVVVVAGAGFAVWYFVIRPKKNQRS